MQRAPPARTRTDRTALREALPPGVPMTARELSQLAGISEDAVHQNLEHLMKSVKAEGNRIVIHPAECLGCGFRFEGRQRTTKPSRCPECRGSRLVPPSFELVVRAPRVAGDASDSGSDAEAAPQPPVGPEPESEL
jgi:predicted Zn-ribbon and HTH transcriptional regulator